MVVAWLKVGQRMDEYMNLLGMTAAISGGGFGAGILGGIDRGVRDANPWYNNAHNTQFGRPGLHVLHFLLELYLVAAGKGSRKMQP